MGMFYSIYIGLLVSHTFQYVYSVKTTLYEVLVSLIVLILSATVIGQGARYSVCLWIIKVFY